MALRIACVGAGWAGTTHIEAAATIPEVVSYTAIVDSDEAHLEETANRFHIDKRYLALDEALADSEIDAIDISTPHRLHVSMAVTAAEAGKHVMVEKPMAMNVAEATAMIDAAEANGVTLFVAENVAYESRIKFLRDVVLEGDLIGELTAATVVAGFRAEGEYGYPGRRAWLTEPEHGGTGTWMLHGIHTIAGMRQVFGEFGSIYLTEHKTLSFPRSDLEGTLTGLLTTLGGLGVGLIQSPETRFGSDLEGYTIHGEKGSIRALPDGWRLIARGEDSELRPYPDAMANSYVRELEAFAAMVAGDNRVHTTGRSERRSLAIVEAGFISLETRAAVDLAETFGDI